ncbi:MAG TPA: molecular chaperone HtpG [Pseudomonadales bacterium]
MAKRQQADNGSTATTYGFQTEAKQLLKLMIHSLYSNREISLRELISNASDAIDKLRFRAIENPELVADDAEYAITLRFDKDAGTITVQDNGIGMTRQEVIDHLGTIARSGTAEFLAQLTGDQKKDAALIGQFGVGFYSAFMVADEVEVLTRAAGTDECTRWRSRGEDSFTVEDAADLPRGTSVILHLNEKSKEFADGYRLRSIVRRYSDHIGVPVRMPKESHEDGESDAEELETVNSARALWTRPRTEISDDEYKAFYKHVAHDFEDPLTWSHNKVEGKLEYTSLMYVPKRAPFDLWNREAPRGLKLYVQRVFIMDDAEQFLPLYLRFIKGVVDCNDLPLNVSREILQQDERVSTIRSALTKRALSMLQTLADKQPDDYRTFYQQFGEVLKEGTGEDFANREAIARLLRFSSTRHLGSDDAKNARVSLDEYLERLVEGQEHVYYLAADSYEAAASSPHLEVFEDRGIEVLLLHERLDEWMMGNLHEYKGKSFQDVTRADLVLPGESKDEQRKDDAADEPLGKRIAEVLGERVEKVRRSKRLKDSPACLVLGEFALGPQMRRIMEAAGQSLPESKPQFEYNAEHPLVARLANESDEQRFRELVLVLFDQASLAGGMPLADPAGYVERMNRLLLELLPE